MFKSERLGIEWDESKRLGAPNRSGIYWGMFSEWWESFSVFGNVLLVGDEYPQGEQLKSFFAKRFPQIENIYLTSLSNSDLNWDILQKFPLKIKFNWVICQAVLEHVTDPVRALKNLASTLDTHGFIMVHSHGPNFPEHRHPIDCFRFMRDGVVALANHADLSIIDMLWTDRHWFLFAGKKD